MNSRYFLRLDDVCPTNNLEKWMVFEKFIDSMNIKPIVCIIPDNKDKALFYSQKDEFYWERIRKWQEKNWHIALHGYDHFYCSKKRGLVPLQPFSEFAGVDISVQREKIRTGYAILRDQGITPRIWVAPAHTFDDNTIRALSSETNIRIISDGLAYYPFVYKEFFWIPQQLWGFELKPKGVWTICLHIDTADDHWIAEQMDLIKKHRNLFDINIDDLYFLYGNRKRSAADYYFHYKHIIKDFVKFRLVYPYRKWRKTKN